MSRLPPPGGLSRDGARMLLTQAEGHGVLRRRLLGSGLSLGALSLLTGCDVGTLGSDDALDRLLWAMLRLNDRLQALLFSDARLAPTYRPDQMTRPFPFNAFYGVDQAPEIDAESWRLDVSGQVSDRTPWTLDRLRKLPQEDQITRLICVEGWSAIGRWSGVPLHVFLNAVGADLCARYVGFRCADRYYSSIDMASALHPQTILALDYDKDELPVAYGAPLRLRIPTKLGFKNPKYITSIFVTNAYPGGYWEDQGYNWFSGL